MCATTSIPSISAPILSVKCKFYSNAFLLLKQQDTEDFYFLTHLTDAALLEYFKDATTCITIFKQQFKAFRDGFLKVLSTRYPLQFISANKEAAVIKTIQLKPKQKIVRMHTFEQ